MSDHIDTREGWTEIPKGAAMSDGGVIEFGEHGRVLRMWVRVPPVPPLPTEPGYYLTTEPDYGGGPVVVELLNRPAGQWVDAGDRQYLNEQQVRDMLPLVRLEPRAVTAKAALGKARAYVFQALSEDVDFDHIAREFGVES